MYICTSGDVGVGERTGEALGEVWLARGATPFDLASLVGAFLPGGDPLLGSDLTPPFIMLGGGGVCGLGGLFLGAAGSLDLTELGGEVCDTGRREEESRRGRIKGWALFCCWRLASRVSIFSPVVAGGGVCEGLGARDRERGGESLLGEGDLECLSCQEMRGKWVVWMIRMSLIQLIVSGRTPIITTALAVARPIVEPT